MRVAFVTNIPSHYRIGLFEKLAEEYETDFFFFSDGAERDWLRKNGLWGGNFHGEFLSGFRIPGVGRVTPSLFYKIASGKYDVVVKCINGKFALPATFITAKLLRRPFILWTGIWSHPKSLAHKVSFPLVRWIYSHSDAIVVYGDHVKRYLVNLGIESKKIFIGWNTVDNKLFNLPVTDFQRSQVRASLGVGADEKLVLYVGRIENEKGLEYLVEAFSAVSKHMRGVLLVIGTGSMKEDLARKASADVKGRVLFLDFVKNSELWKYYSIADVFVLPSVSTKMNKETWGLVINEAMNQGCPVIATDAVGAAVGGLLEDGKTGLVVPEADSVRLADAITKILCDPQLTRDMKQAALKKIAGWNYERQANGFAEAINYVAHKLNIS